jgi:hypothetical protein
LAEEVPFTVSEVEEGYAMPYVRLYSRHLQIEQKRVIAQKLIEITLRAFRLRADERYQTSIQFITVPRWRVGNDVQPPMERENEFMVEVLGHDLTDRKKRAFAEEASAMLSDLVPPGPWSRIARVFGIRGDRPEHVALQFHELSPAISDPLVVYTDRLIA